MFLHLKKLLPNKKKYKTVYLKDFSFQNSDIFIVPERSLFFFR